MTASAGPAIRIRPWDRALEEGLVFDTWLKSLRHDIRARGGDGRHVRDGRWFDGQRKVIERCVSAADVLVAELEGIILGWICADAQAVHYAYVKEDYRGRGVYLRLAAPALSGETITATHLTRTLMVWKAKGLPYEYDPFAVPA